MDQKLDEIRLPDGTLPAYAWPGGYPMFYIDNEGDTLCPECANKAGMSTTPVAYDVNYEDPNIHCDNCSKRIPSAYAG